MDSKYARATTFVTVQIYLFVVIYAALALVAFLNVKATHEKPALVARKAVKEMKLVNRKPTTLGYIMLADET